MKSYFSAAMLLALVACTQSETTSTTTETTTTIEQTQSTAPVMATEETATTVTLTETTTTTTVQPSASATATATRNQTRKGRQAPSQEKSMSNNQDKVAVLHTSEGDIAIRFYPDVAPNHVKNFLTLAQSGFYDGTKFHRVIPGFMIQGGDPNTKTDNAASWGTGGAGSNINAEFNGVAHKRGVVSMARSSSPNSASSQFFIVVKDSPFLDRQYTVFGRVTSGMNVADKIVNAPRDQSNDRPNRPVAIKNITIREAMADEKGAAPQ